MEEISRRQKKKAFVLKANSEDFCGHCYFEERIKNNLQEIFFLEYKGRDCSLQIKETMQERWSHKSMSYCIWHIL